MYNYNCECQNGNFACEFGINTNPMEIMDSLLDSFNRVKIVDNNTGEVIADHYVSTDFFKARRNPFYAIEWLDIPGVKKD